MKVASKFSVGFALALLPLVGVLAYIVGQVDRLANANRTLSTVQFSAAIDSVRLMRQLELLGEYAGKYAISGDARYAEKVDEARGEVAAVVAELSALELSAPERAETSAFASGWQRFDGALLADMAALAATEEPGRLPALDHLEDLRAQAHQIIGSTRATIDAQGRAAEQVSEHAQHMSFLVAGGALAVSLLVFLFTFRAIHRPLRRLAEGTRAVSRGQFDIELDERGTDELAELSRAFNRMVRDIYKLLRIKSEFVSHVSHELKTPLVSMHETSQLLLDGIPGPLNDKQRRLLELNVAATRRLSAMITDLLELSRRESEGVPHEPAPRDLRELATRAVAELETRANDRKVDVAVLFPDRPLVVPADGDRLIQVVHNLVDNALKHTPAGGTVQVRGGLAGDHVVPAGIRASLAGGDAQRFALLEVDDSGPGLDDDERERVFERFYQGARGKRGGFGLGLAICRQIVGAHGGVIWATDSALGGACFAVVLPCTDEPAIDRVDTDAPAEAARA